MGTNFRVLILLALKITRSTVLDDNNFFDTCCFQAMTARNTLMHLRCKGYILLCAPVPFFSAVKFVDFFGHCFTSRHAQCKRWCSVRLDRASFRDNSCCISSGATSKRRSGPRLRNRDLRATEAWVIIKRCGLWPAEIKYTKCWKTRSLYF